MRYRAISSAGIQASVIGVGTAAIGGTDPGAPLDDRQSIRAIHAALDHGVNLIDTAPSYGWGHAEEVVGQAISDRREKVIIATKCGIWWQDQRGSYNGTKNGKETYVSLRPDTIAIEIENSLKRLGVEHIDLLQCHKPAIPPEETPVEETMDCLMGLKQQGKIRAIGVSNVSIKQLEHYRKAGDLDSNQFRYSMLSRDPELEMLPHCKKHKVATLTYWSLEYGLLTGKLGAEHVFPNHDFRATSGKWLPWFKAGNRGRLENMFAGWSDLTSKYDSGIAEICLAWTAAQTGVTHTLCGIRTPEQAIQNSKAGQVILEEEEINRIDLDLLKLGDP